MQHTMNKKMLNIHPQRQIYSVYYIKRVYQNQDFDTPA